MEKKLNTLERGDTFTLAGINWLVLGVNPKAYPNSNDHYLVEATAATITGARRASGPA